MYYLGVDVAKAKLDCMLLDSSTGKVKSKSIANTSVGFVQLLEWLDKQKAGKPHVVMEPTGMYHENAALALADAGLVVSLINPAQLRAFAQGLGVKTKNDRADSAVLARYGATQNPAPWQPPSESARRLKALLARRDAVADDLQRERNRQEANNFSPAPGKLTMYVSPSGKGVRVDSHCYAGYTIPPHYDSMIAKLIVHGTDRADAIRILEHALGDYVIDGIKTTIGFHQRLIRDARFLNNEVTTKWVDEVFMKQG